ncbi:pentatricopeptide repeat-containing protein 1, mitochondrial [Myripristis murdjan]|uniref:Pentatricopeptide repeat domain 1 n=1 Tax=Myripristis murdjan TaxID=586833 RepID=A0A667WDY0_9TELE|nr:pentatricopeptide repeat-containing protein 1, mitochondrial-like [Myripristis murdjan]
MFTSAACSCVRNGRKVSAHVGRLSRLCPKRSSASTGPCRPLTQRPWLVPVAQTQVLPRAVSFSAASRADVASPGAPTDPAESAPPEDGVRFGSLSADFSSRRSFRKSSPDTQDLRFQDDVEEDLGEPVKSGSRNTPYWYFLQCKKLIKENKLQEALDLFSRDMLRGERLQPEEYNYSVLIGGCGRAGHLKRAFRLYNDMKKRGLVASDATYTALFNACAESPWKQTGLQQALHLEQELRRKNYPLSSITYHALLKTHAVTNHLQACIHTLREMRQNGHALTQETFHYLLMACLKDKEAGFRLALQIWRQMLRSGIRPDSTNYNLLLRTARDCGVGDLALATDLLLGPDLTCQNGRDGMANVRPESRRKDPVDIDLLERELLIQPGQHSHRLSHNNTGNEIVPRAEEEPCSKQNSTQLVVVRERENVSLPCELQGDSGPPNLLDFFEGKRGGVVSLGTVNETSDRLAVIGGAKGVLEKMADNGLSPDLKTLTLLADVMEPSRESLQMLLQVAKQYKVKLDVAFFNSVIRRSARAGDLDGAKAVLAVMRQRNVNVNIQTYGSLALGCERQRDGLQLLKDMEEARFRPNVQVFSALIGHAARRLDYIYLRTLLKSMTAMGVWPNEIIIRQLEFAAQYPPNYDQYKTRDNYLVHIDGFRGYYQQWLRAMPALGAEDKQAEPQAETDQEGPADGLTESERNKKAAARRYRTHKGSKQSSSVSVV